MKVRARFPSKILVTPELVERTRQLRHRYKHFNDLIVAEFDSSMTMYRVVDEEEMRRILQTGQVTGGTFSVKPEREMGASWGKNPSDVIAFGLGWRKQGRLKGRLFLLKLEAIGKTFLHLGPENSITENPWETGIDKPVVIDFDADRAYTGLGASIEDVSLNDLDGVYEVDQNHQITKVDEATLKRELLNPIQARLDAALQALFHRTSIPTETLATLEEAKALLSSYTYPPSQPHSSELSSSDAVQLREEILRTFDLRSRAEQALNALAGPMPEPPKFSDMILDADAEVEIGAPILGSDRNHGGLVVLIPIPEPFASAWPDPEAHNHGHRPHVTLCYVMKDDPTPGQLSDVLTTVRRVCHRFPPFRLRLDVNAGLKDFGDGKEGEKALWHSVLCEPRGEVERLHRALKIALEQEGIPVQSHSDFVPHVTWSYVSNWIPDAERASMDSVAGDRLRKGVAWTVNAVLVSTPGGDKPVVLNPTVPMKNWNRVAR